MNNQGSL